jgi:predicted Rossmann fold nucleotide-binding protein DprA/Smf involved in DNA uptake
MGSEPVNIDSLVETTALPVDMAASLLSNLEIAGLIESLPGGGYVRRRD